MWHPLHLWRFLKSYKKGMQMLEQLHKTHQFQWVYSHTLAVLLGIRFAQKHQIKHLWHVQEIIPSPRLYFWLFVKFLSSKPNTLAIYDSKETMLFWCKDYPKLANKSHFVWNGLDLAAKPAPNAQLREHIRKTAFGVHDQHTVIGLFGRINSWKGQNLLAEAFAHVAPLYPMSKLVFIGSTPPNQDFFLTQLEQQVADLGIQAQVVILPFQNDIWPYWEAIDIAVVPSTQPEPFGMVAIEAMSCAKPVIAARHGGLTEIVIHEQTGLFFEPLSTDGLAQALETLLTAPERCKAMGAAGQKRVQEVFTIEVHTRKIEQLLLQP